MLQGNRKKIHASKVYQQYSILDLQYAEFAKINSFFFIGRR